MPERLALLALAALLLAGCNDVVYPPDVARAERLCAANGGWERIIHPGATDHLHIKCKNGAAFDFYNVEE